MALENWMLPCLFKATSGMSCPWCGFQRGLVELLAGNFSAGVAIFPPLVPMLLLFITLCFRLYKPNRKSLKSLYVSFGLVILTLLINFFIKNFNLW